MIDREQIYKWWSIFQEDGNKLCEIRVLGKNKETYSGYYRNIENIIRDIEPLSNNDSLQFYFILNNIATECYDRTQHEHLIKFPKETTKDNNIIGRDYILLDFDPERTSGTGSTKEQLNNAHAVAKRVYDYLLKEGFCEPIVCKSGNGYHLLLKVGLKNDEESLKLVDRFIKALDIMFSTDKCHVDTSVDNAARVCKLYGTYAKKGANTEERPWRLAKILKVPDNIQKTDKSYIEKIASIYHAEPPKPSKENNFGQERFDLLGFFAKHGIEYRASKISSGTRYILKECPFGGSDHADPDSMVFQYDNGALEFSCFHNGCQQYHWKDFRLHYEPDAYDKKEYKEFQYKKKYYEKYTLPTPTEIKAESDELGKKWYTLRDIKIIRDSERFSIKTGIYALDKALGGLFECETTILSGINASGKTAILNQLLLNAVQRNIPSALWSGELPADRLKSWLCLTAAGKQYVSKIEGRDNAYEVDENVIEKIEDWIDERLLIYNNNYGNNSEQLLSDVEEAIKKYNLKFAVFDNLMAMSLEDIVGTANERQKALMIKLDAMAKKYKIHILIIAHPRKEANFQLLRKESISGTSDLTNICWNLLLIHRVGDDFEKRATEFWGKDRTQKLIFEGYTNIIEVAKNRDYGVVDYVVGLYYEPETKRFKNTKAEQIHYDWEEKIQTYHLPEKTAPMPVNTDFDNQSQISQNTTISSYIDFYDASHENDEELPF